MECLTDAAELARKQDDLNVEGLHAEVAPKANREAQNHESCWQQLMAEMVSAEVRQAVVQELQAAIDNIVEKV